MANLTRCPICNGLGSSLPNNVCRRCDKDIYKNKLHKECRGSVKLIDGVLLEFGIKNIESIKPDQRSAVLQMVRRRSPVNRSGHLVKDDTDYTKHGYAFYDEPDKYTLIKGDNEIEHK